MSQLVEVGPFVELSSPASRRSLRWQMLALSVSIIWLYSSVVSRLVMQWWKDPNCSHGFFVPLFSLFLLVHDLPRLRRLPAKPTWWGLLIVAFSMALLVTGVLGAELFLSRVSLLFLMLGLIALFGGWAYCRALVFPWAFLLLMIPIPAILFNQITLPLQILASKAAAEMLPWFGVPVLRQGNVINLPKMSLEVAEACSGVRSLLALITLSIIYGYLMEKDRFVRILLVLSAVPIAIWANSFRIVGTGLLVQYWDPDKAEGFFHAFQGLLIFVVSLTMLFLFHKFLCWARRHAGPVRG
jgi:exosortase